MGRILAIDYGKKRSGIAVTDPLQIIASGLCTVETPSLLNYIKKYILSETVDRVIIGLPKTLRNEDTDATPLVIRFISVFKTHIPQIPIETIDERFTSKMATQSMLQSGLKKKDRLNKALIDEISATIILQDYLASLSSS